ncbi:MAG: 4Fe-4S dicluster domain-containing protein [Methylococcales bacterium]|jgi:sulfhydrogenase subunit beta (sulfur reductase)|nr:4Fe-4S dicluster domain-containing protein [Methylococcales bacterium]MBT7443701.1 4Fe-4S dicluster domain-containing protein [Methylococcales bacterium]
MKATKALFLPRHKLNDLFQSFIQSGFNIITPIVQNGSLRYHQIRHANEITPGAIDDSHMGKITLAKTKSPRFYSFTTTEQSIKPWVFSPKEVLWQSDHSQSTITFKSTPPNTQPTLVFGIKGCDLAGLNLLDQHFNKDPSPDPHYQQRRASLSLIGLNCHRSGANCFCNSTQDGPKIETDTCDALMSELDEGFIFHHSQTDLHARLTSLKLSPATPEQLRQAEYETQAAAAEQQKKLPKISSTDLFEQDNHPEWEKVAERCLSCGNCTAVCPSCFCHTIEAKPTLSNTSEQTRQWDSCFTTQHSYLHGIYIRPERIHRYRQWLTHKFSGWQAQYGRIGCTGCGRCITYCPVGIDPSQALQTLLRRQEDI